MINNNLQKFLFHLTSVLTTWFPRFGAWLLNALVTPVLGNRLLVRVVREKNLEKIREVKQFKKILVIPDIHIGDAVMLQGAVMAFRDYFPDARVDYIVKNAVSCLIEGNPAISNLYPYFTGTVFPTPSDIESIKKLVVENQYDLCFNCSPFFEDHSLFPTGQKILNLMTSAPQLVRNDIDHVGINHFMTQSYEFVYGLLRDTVPSRPTKPFRGVPVHLADSALEEAKGFLSKNGLTTEKPIVFLNPDTASPFTRIPVEKQLEFLKLLAQMPVQILLGAAFTFKDTEKQLVESLTAEERSKVTVVPKALPLDAYNALIDLVDVFVSGDTGPLHMAAARKCSKTGNIQFRNKTFVISIFGATPARMSGYDSTDPLFPPANQDVVSRTFVSESPCRNITCVNKMAKTCKDIRCFEVLDVAVIAGDIKAYLKV